MSADDLAYMDEMARRGEGEMGERDMMEQDMERIATGGANDSAAPPDAKTEAKTKAKTKAKTETEMEKKRVLEGVKQNAKEFVKNSKVDSQRFIMNKTNAKGAVIGTFFDILGFSRWLIEESGKYFVTVRGDEDVYMYEDGVYIKYGEAHIRSILHHIMHGEYITTHVEKEVIARVRALTYEDWGVFDGDEDIMNMNNGLYRFSTGEFMPHTPDYKTLTKSEVRYDKDAKCPEIDKFFKGMAEPERLMTLYEIFGYALMPRKLYKRGFILYGRPDTGKTKYASLLSAFVGQGAVACVYPTTLAKYEHAGAELYGKLANILDDLGDTPITDTGMIKSLIGDGLIRINPKGKEGRTILPQVTNLWCCNELPKITDKSFGEKFDLLRINNKYGGQSKPDHHLLEKITEPSEMSGLFNKAVAAFKGVEKRGEFTGSGSSSERRREWEHTSRPIARFVDERCELIDWSPDDEGGIVLADGFYKAYTQFVREIDGTTESRQVVRSYLAGTYSVFSTKKRLNSESLRACYLGIAIKPVSGNKPRKGGLEHQTPQSGDGGTGKMKAETKPETAPPSPSPSEDDDDFDPYRADLIRKAIKELGEKSNGSDGVSMDDICTKANGIPAAIVYKYLTVYMEKIHAEKVSDGFYRVTD